MILFSVRLQDSQRNVDEYGCESLDELYQQNNTQNSKCANVYKYIDN